MMEVASVRVIGSRKYEFVYSDKRAPRCDAVAMRIRASGGVARVVHMRGKTTEDEAWVVYANDRGKPTARAMIDAMVHAAA